MSTAYEFRIEGQISPELLRTFRPTRTYEEDDRTVIVRTIEDDGELFGVIGRCETLGLRLVALRQLTTEPRS